MRDLKLLVVNSWSAVTNTLIFTQTENRDVLTQTKLQAHKLSLPEYSGIDLYYCWTIVTSSNNVCAVISR
jgi:hypothetical protein